MEEIIMNENYYLVPMWNRQNKRTQNHLALIKAPDRYQAMLIAIGSHGNMDGNGNTISEVFYTEWNVDMNYEAYQECKKPKEVFTYMDRSGNINKNKEDSPIMMTDLLYDFIYMKDYNKNISDLAEMSLPEKWTFQSEENNSILKKYLSKTLERLQEENKVITTDNFCAFNTGLFTQNYESIYLLAEKSSGQNLSKEWAFKEFCTEYKFDSTDISNLPQRANYFEDPSLLLFDWHYPVRVQYGHILDENQHRLPDCIANSKMKLKLFTGIVDTSIKRVIANYKLAVPQYYEGKIQLLIPLFFEDDNKPDLALVVTKKDGYYQGHTCLTLDMAYNNARLIAKPESNWLAP